MIFNAYHRKREDNLFENVRFLIWNFFKVLRYTCRMHYCWPKKCYVYYPHYSNYFLIVHAVFNADKITFRKMMFLDYANFLNRQMLQNREWWQCQIENENFLKAVQFFLVFKCQKGEKGNVSKIATIILAHYQDLFKLKVVPRLHWYRVQWPCTHRNNCGDKEKMLTHL